MNILGFEVAFGTAVQIVVGFAVFCLVCLLTCRGPARSVATAYRRRRTLRRIRHVPHVQLAREILVHSSERDQRLRGESNADETEFVADALTKGLTTQQ